MYNTRVVLCRITMHRTARRQCHPSPHSCSFSSAPADDEVHVAVESHTIGDSSSALSVPAKQALVLEAEPMLQAAARNMAQVDELAPTVLDAAALAGKPLLLGVTAVYLAPPCLLLLPPLTTACVT